MVEVSNNGSSFASKLLVIFAIIFTVSAVKQICDLKEQNLSLLQQLAFERQKDAALKLAVRDNIPAQRFIQHRFSYVEAGQVEAEGKVDQPTSTWSINLSVLWTSPLITSCDMARLSHILAQEIYAHQEEQVNEVNPWTFENEMETNENIEKKERAVLTNLIQSESSEEANYDSSEESSEDDLALLKISSSEDVALERMIDEDLDYFLSEAAIWDDSEEYNLFGDDSTEADYYNYY